MENLAGLLRGGVLVLGGLILMTRHPIILCVVVLMKFVLLRCWVGVVLGASGGRVLLLCSAGGVLVLFSFVVGLCPSPLLKVGKEEN